MSTDRDDRDERQIRVDRMIDEFRKAQARRLSRMAAGTGEGQVVDMPREAESDTAVAVSTPTPPQRSTD